MKGPILALVEHRKGEIRDITYELLRKAHELSQRAGSDPICLLIQAPGQGLEAGLKGWAKKILVIEAKGCEVFNSELYKAYCLEALRTLEPFIVLLPHTPWGMDLAPALSVKAGLPLISDCVDIVLENGDPKAIRQIYGGKLYSQVAFRPSSTYLASMRPGSIQVEGNPGYETELLSFDTQTPIRAPSKTFEEFVETGQGDVDISQAPFLISIGRGIGDEERIQEVKDLAEKLGAILSCSRPIVDKNWLPKYHQVGTSGKTVKPKVYLALGISGAFQHVAGIKGSGTIIAVNKDKKAPIFRAAHYGVAEDLFTIVSALKAKIGG